VTDKAGRRRIAHWVLAFLIVAHLGTFLGYVLLTRQQDHRQLYLEARDEWRAGDRGAAARDYRRFLAGYAEVTTPVVLVRGFPSAASAWFSLGRVEAELGEVDPALDAFSRAMAQEPGLGRREYRDLLFESGRYAALEAYARATLAREPDSLAASYDLGAALYASGRPAEAAAAYALAITRVPAYLRATDPNFHGTLSAREAELMNLESVALLAAGDAPRARAACTALGRRMTPGVHLDLLCRAHLALADGDLAAARAAASAYLPRAPEEARMMELLAARLAPPS